MNKFLKAFTLIELLVVISIIGILIGLSIFGLEGARKSSRDGKRKADLELIRSGLEIYRADCDAYPTTAQLPLAPNSALLGTGAPSTCLKTNTYISQVPGDPIPSQLYSYTSNGTTYTICAALEQGGAAVAGCGSCGTATCNYQVKNP